MPVLSRPGSDLPLFAHRSGRVIAAGRAVLATLFALWVWIAPDQPARAAEAGYVLLALYLAFAVLALGAAWRDWWLDFHLSRLAFALDCCVFAIAILFTEDGSADFFSPYMAFFAFLILSAVLRWNWIVALTAAAGLCGAFLLSNWLLTLNGVELFHIRLLRRTSYMAVMSLMVVWLAVRRGGVVINLADLPDSGSTDLAPANALHWAMAGAKAAGAALAWQGTEEPRGVLHLSGALGNGHQALPKEIEDITIENSARLFDATRQHSLLAGDEGPLRALRNVAPPQLATWLRLTTGMSVPLRGEHGDGVLLLAGVPGLSRDDLALGQALAVEVTRVLDRAWAADAARVATTARIRTDLARDLHDSVAQTLAGTGFRLAALRARIGAGEQPLAELDELGANLTREQQTLRSMIDSLREPERIHPQADLGSALEELLPGLARQWSITATIENPPGAIRVSPTQLFDCLQIVREGIANAVRHGGADKVTIALAEHGGALQLEIADNGRGLRYRQSPRSIAERVAAMQGSLMIASVPGATRLEIELPRGERG